MAKLENEAFILYVELAASKRIVSASVTQIQALAL
jgi:hypothetical protein